MPAALAMSALAMAEAPWTSTWRTRKPAAAKRPAMEPPMFETSRWPRWPVASVTPSASARMTTAPASASLGEGPCGSRAAFADLRAGPPRDGLGGALTGGFACPREPPRTAAAIRILRDPKHQSVEIPALPRRLLWDQQS